jgi:hypothetical protein
MSHAKPPAPPDAEHLITRPIGDRSTADDQARDAGRSQRFTSLQANCPWVRAAARLGDPVVISALIRLHPPLSCPAARRERPARG